MLTDNFIIHRDKHTGKYIVHCVTDFYDITITGTFRECYKWLKSKGVI